MIEMVVLSPLSFSTCSGLLTLAPNDVRGSIELELQQLRALEKHVREVVERTKDV